MQIEPGPKTFWDLHLHLSGHCYCANPATRKGWRDEFTAIAPTPQPVRVEGMNFWSAPSSILAS